MPLQIQNDTSLLEAGVDEAGRGCLAGPVVAAAVILPVDFRHPDLNDSKQVSHKMRLVLREVIQKSAISWKIGVISPARIDQINILRASFEAMFEAIAGLNPQPEALLIDGNRFPKHSIPATCMVKGDARFLNIAAASILAKTYRDEIMETLAIEWPQYGWKQNKGYPTLAHRKAIAQHGISPWHRKSFNMSTPLTLF